MTGTFHTGVSFAQRCFCKGRKVWLGEAEDDRRWLVGQYHAITGRLPDLDQPEGFLEKLLWLNLYYRDPAIPPLVDKWLARDYVARRVGPEVLPDLLGVWDNPEQIPFESLPNQFVLKATAGCAWNIICYDKSTLDFQDAKAKLSRWQGQNYYHRSREWQYRSLKSKIIAEAMMVDPAHPGKSVPDVKVYCFNGTPRVVGISTDRRGDVRHDFFDTEWNPVDFGLTDKPRCSPPLQRFPDLDRILEIAATLSRDFPFVRVDLYRHQGRIVFGEMTFSPSAGLMRIQMPEADRLWGSWRRLPARSSEKR